MNPPSHLSPEERKRIRDRHSQRKHREKRDLHTRQLEELVAFCQRNHDGAHIRYLSQRVVNLEAENSVLLKERDRLLDFVHQMQKSLSYLFPHLRGKGGHGHAGGPEIGVHERLVASHFDLPKRTDDVATLPGVDAASIRGVSQPVPRPDLSISSQQGFVAHMPSTGVHDVATIVTPPPLQHLLIGGGPQVPFAFSDSLLSQSLAADPDGLEATAHTQSGGEEAGLQLAGAGEVPISREEDAAVSASQAIRSSTQSFGVTTHAPSLNASNDLSKSNTELDTRNSLNAADWLRLPAVSSSFDEKRGHSGWLKFPHAVAMSPDVPEPEDILFGSRKNFLANEIHKSMRKIHLAEPERMAIGWLGYVVSKWRVGPTRESFERMPSFLRPTPQQIHTPHPACLDVVPWPGLRNALMKQPLDDQMHDIMDLVSCCIKIRWPWGKEILEIKEDNSRHVKDEFYQTLMSLERWGITREFVRAYPHLLENLDVEGMEISMC